MANLRAGVIGLNLGRSHARAYAACEGFDLVALCDIVPERLAERADELDVSGRYADYVEMLDAERLDVVSVATTQALHAEMTITAASRGVQAIICEKAMANSMGEAEAMLAACDRNGVKLAIGHQGRHLPAFEKARDLVTSGAIGRPLIVSVSVEEGGLMNQGSHLLDRIIYVLGEPEPLWALGQVQRETDRYERGDICEDLSFVLACVEGGTRIVYDNDIGPHGDLGTRTFIFTGDEGTMILATRPGGPSMQYGLKLMSATADPIDMPGSAFETRDGMLEQMKELVTWLAGESEHRQDAHNVIKSHAIMMGLRESARTHTLVKFPIRTKANPLELMVEEGALPVRYPGRYDIRHRHVYAQDEVG